MIFHLKLLLQNNIKNIMHFFKIKIDRLKLNASKVKLFKNKNGYTLVELLVVALITSIILTGTLKVYVYLTRNNSALKTSLQVQQDLNLACRFIEKDIQMAGYKVPGNGIVSNTSVSEDQKIHIFSNKKGISTDLSFDVYKGDKILKVNEAIGADKSMWICLSSENNTVYYPIKNIKLSSSKPDTVILDTLLEFDWKSEKTTIHFVEHVFYQIENTSNGRSLTRNSITSKFITGNHISQIDIKCLDLNKIKTNIDSDARNIAITLGAPCSDAHGNRVITEKILVNIRNFK